MRGAARDARGAPGRRPRLPRTLQPRPFTRLGQGDADGRGGAASRDPHSAPPSCEGNAQRSRGALSAAARAGPALSAAGPPPARAPPAHLPAPGLRATSCDSARAGPRWAPRRGAAVAREGATAADPPLPDPPRPVAPGTCLASTCADATCVRAWDLQASEPHETARFEAHTRKQVLATPLGAGATCRAGASAGLVRGRAGKRARGSCVARAQGGPRSLPLGEARPPQRPTRGVGACAHRGEHVGRCRRPTHGGVGAGARRDTRSRRAGQPLPHVHWPWPAFQPWPPPEE